MAFLLHQARFYTTVNHLRDLPATVQPEIAFAGRSNAGKSTAINVLCNQKRLAFASKTPGRTQHINYFGVGPADEPAGYVVDLPGLTITMSAPSSMSSRTSRSASSELAGSI
jgi:GTP-binding protein